MYLLEKAVSTSEHHSVPEEKRHKKSLGMRQEGIPLAPVQF